MIALRLTKLKIVPTGQTVLQKLRPPLRANAAMTARKASAAMNPMVVAPATYMGARPDRSFIFAAAGYRSSYVIIVYAESGASRSGINLTGMIIHRTVAARMV